MLTSTLQKLLAKTGYQLRRIPPKPPGHGLHAAFDRKELEEIHRLIAAEVRQKNLTGINYDSYLSPKRLSLFHEVADVIEDACGPLDGKRVFEIGAFYGVLLRFLKSRSPAVDAFGIESFERVVPVGATVSGADVRHGSLTEIPFEGPFDCVVLTEVLEHQVDPYSVLRGLAELAPEGKLILTVPNGRYDNMEARKFFEDFQSYEGHINFWSPESWEQFFQRALPDRVNRTGMLPAGNLFAVSAPSG